MYSANKKIMSIKSFGLFGLRSVLPNVRTIITSPYLKFRATPFTKEHPNYESTLKLPLLIDSVKYPWGQYNGHHSWLKGEANMWARKFIDDDDFYEEIIEEDMGGYGGAIVLRGAISKERLLNGTKLLMCPFIYDSFIEDFVEKQKESDFFETMRTFAKHLLHNRYDPNDAECPQEKIYHLWADSFEGMRDTGLTQFQQKRLVNYFCEYLDRNEWYEKTKKIQSNSKKQLFNDMDSFILFRRTDVWSDIVHVSSEHVHGIAIDEQTFNHPQFSDLLTHATDWSWCANDLASFTKEAAINNTSRNFITVYSQLNNATIAESHNALVKHCKDVDAKFQKSLNDVMHSHLILKSPDVVTFCKYACPNWVYGFGQWEDVSGRYRADCKSKWGIINPYLTVDKQMKILGKTYFD